MQHVQSKNKYYYAIIVLLYLFLIRDFLERYFKFAGYIDEVIALIAVFVFAYKLLKTKKITVKKIGYAKYICFFCVIGLLGNVINQFQPVSVVLIDLFTCCKFWLVIYLGKVFFSEFKLQAYAKKIYIHITFFICFLMILTIMDNIVHVFPGEIRYGVQSTQLFYSHPTILVSVCVFLFSLLIVLKEFVGVNVVYFITLIIIIFSTLRSKAIAVGILMALLYYFEFIRNKKFTFKTLILFIPAIVALSWNQIVFYFFSDIRLDSARYQLLNTSVQIANDFFPLGSGFGTFGSYQSGIFYSKIYDIYKIAGVNGIRKGATAFISDSFWPMILGQSGWLGLIAFLIVITILIRKIIIVRNTNKIKYVSGMCIIMYLFISSLAESAFVNPIAISLAFLLGYILNKNT